MSEWTCRTCGGGFPRPVQRWDSPACPWCGEEIGKAIDVGYSEALELTDNHDDGEI